MLDRLALQLAQPALWWELGVLLACLGVAAGMAWAIGRRRESSSVWFGRFIVDGLLFPLLSLALVYSAMLVVARFQPVALLHLAVPVLLALAGIRFLARVLTVVFPTSAAARLVERLFSWLAWLMAVLWIGGVLQPVLARLEALRFTVGKTQVSVLGLIENLLVAGVVLVLTLWISAALERRVMRQATGDLSLRRVAANVVRAGLLLVGVLAALSTLGVDLTALSVLGGAIGVGLGFGLQKLASNYVSGFVILFERSLRIGDTVRVDNFEGQVMDIKTRYTLIRAPNGRESIVPNEKLITERIENLSLADPLILLSTDVAVGYDSDVDEVQRLLCEAATGCARVLKDPAPAARLARFGADGLEFQLLFWIGDPANGQLNVRSEVNLAVLKSLRQAGIVIPYPQRVVHLVGSEATAGR
nr:mechanosensitive ion channel domain-containing protein [Ramlibacter rhizophilus]